MTDYRAYLESDEWRWKANAAKEAAGCCAVCGATTELETHHKTYVRVGHERLSDLVVLCRRCHLRYHGTFDDCAQQLLLTWPGPAA